MVEYIYTGRMLNGNYCIIPWQIILTLHEVCTSVWAHEDVPGTTVGMICTGMYHSTDRCWTPSTLRVTPL